MYIYIHIYIHICMCMCVYVCVVIVSWNTLEYFQYLRYRTLDLYIRSNSACKISFNNRYFIIVPTNGFKSFKELVILSVQLVARCNGSFILPGKYLCSRTDASQLLMSSFLVRLICPRSSSLEVFRNSFQI